MLMLERKRRAAQDLAYEGLLRGDDMPLSDADPAMTVAHWVELVCEAVELERYAAGEELTCRTNIVLITGAAAKYTPRPLNCAEL